jgi:predicted metal-binding membrane protein
VFVAGCALVFGASAAATVRLCAPMVGGMGMPGGWTLSMAWMRMPGQGWAGAWGMFAGTWAIMMVAMMLPAIAPALWRCGSAAGAGSAAGVGGQFGRARGAATETAAGVGGQFGWARGAATRTVTSVSALVGWARGAATESAAGAGGLFGRTWGAATETASGVRALVAGAGIPGLVRAPGVRALIAGAGYFAVWAAIGGAVYPAGALLADAAMRSAGLARAEPIAAAAVLLLAGALQLTRWKARQLERCRAESGGGEGGGAGARATPSPAGLPCCVPPTASAARPAPGPGAAFRTGLRLGGHCALCCTGLMATLLVLGAMDARAMAGIGAAIAGERLLPRSWGVARAIGVVLVGLGLVAGARVMGMV